MSKQIIDQIAKIANENFVCILEHIELIGKFQIIELSRVYFINSWKIKDIIAFLVGAVTIIDFVLRSLIKSRSLIVMR